MTAPMSEDGFQITPADVLAANRALGKVCDRIQEALDSIGAANSKLLAGWEGEAQQEFLARQARWNSDAEEIKNRLRHLVGQIERVVHGYVEADRAGANVIRGG